MALSMVRSSRFFALAATLSLSSVSAVAGLGCSAADGHDANNEGTDGASTEAITDVNNSSVKRQSIGNCWIYASAGWLESLNKSATGKELNVSESYWTMWHWFDQIANGSLSSSDKEVSTGGSFGVAADLMARYGVMGEADFIAEEANVEMSEHQRSALAAINTSLATGALKTATARKNRTLVRTELNKAFGLKADVVAQLDRVFGASVSKTLDKTAVVTGTKVLSAKTMAVKMNDATTHAPVALTLADVIGKRASSWDSERRTGVRAWNEVTYPSDAHGRRAFQERVQRALHDKQPVIISWFVDFNALDNDGRFFEPPATPGRQGGHMTVMEDYEATNVPGFGTLKAGVDATPAQMQAALDDKTSLTFIRVKNSWGSYRPDRNFATPGYHDLYMTYLNGPVKKCAVDADENPDVNNCSNATPLWGAVLPAGY